MFGNFFYGPPKGSAPFSPRVDYEKFKICSICMCDTLFERSWGLELKKNDFDWIFKNFTHQGAFYSPPLRDNLKISIEPILKHTKEWQRVLYPCFQGQGIQFWSYFIHISNHIHFIGCFRVRHYVKTLKKHTRKAENKHRTKTKAHKRMIEGSIPMFSRSGNSIVKLFQS